MTAERPAYVVDATVVGKWFVPGEVFSQEARAMFDDNNAARISLFAPYHQVFEVPNIICKAVGGNRLPPELALALVRRFLALALQWTDEPALREVAVGISVTYSCSFYDGLYLALASSLAIPFVHADARLRRSLNGRHPLELWIADYKSPAS